MRLRSMLSSLALFTIIAPFAAVNGNGGRAQSDTCHADI